MRYIYFVIFDTENLKNAEISSGNKITSMRDIEALEQKLEQDLNIKDVVILYFRLLRVEPQN